jgi:hypothetical protein
VAESEKPTFRPLLRDLREHLQRLRERLEHEEGEREALEKASRLAQGRVRRLLVALVIMSLGWIAVLVCRTRAPEPVASAQVEPPPDVPTRPMPEELLPGQMPATNGCPEPYVELKGKKGCWLEAAKKPPCGLLYDFYGRCYAPKMVWVPMPSVQDPRRMKR